MVIMLIWLNFNRGANPVSSLGDSRSNFTKICNITSLGYDFELSRNPL